MTGDSSASSTLSSFSRSSLSRSPPNSSLCSPNSFSSDADLTSFVPFLWEEKPGVSKLETPKFGGEINGLCPLSSEIADSTVSTLLIPKADHSSIFPPLRPPPRLQKSSKLDPPHHNGENEVSGARANAVSQSLSRKWQHRRFKSEEDPFWLAMKVCTNERTGNFDLVRGGMKETSAIQMKEKDQQSVDFLLSFKVPADRENRVTKKSVRARTLRSSSPNNIVGTGDKQAHAIQSSGKKVGIQTFHGKGGQVIPDGDVSCRSSECPTGIVALEVLKSSKNRPRSHSFDSEREEFEPTVHADGKKGIRMPMQSKHYSSQPVELSCGLRVKLKQPSHKQFMPDLLSCKSINLFFDTVTDPSIYRGGRVSSR